MGQPKKIVHVLGAMDIGGVESWLMTILRNSDEEQYIHEFIVHRDKKAYFDDEIKQLGSTKYVCTTDNMATYPFKLYNLLRQIKPDVVHSHVHSFSGLVLMVAAMAGVKTRISHSHSDTRLVESTSKNRMRESYLKLMRSLIKKYSTSNIAVSEKAAISLYGKDWQRDSKNKIIYCGVDYNRFKDVKCSINYRDDLSIPKDAIVIGHVGRIEKPKNHAFMIEIIKELRETSDKYYLVFVGNGSLRQSIEALAEDNGVKPFVRFMGTRSDIPEIMCCLFDIFIFPSLWEGLPLTLVEAQFANLPCLVSDAVTKECDLGFSNYLPINDLGIWVNKIGKINNNLKEINFEKSKFNLSNSQKIINAEYLLRC